MAQSNVIKAFTRLDGSGRIIPSSTVLRKEMPKTVKWIEIQAYECCGASVFLSTTPADVSLSTVVFTLTCDATDVAVATLTPTVATVTVEDVVAVLNDKIGFYGLFSVAADGVDIELRLKDTISAALCSDEADLSFTIS